MVAGSKMVRSAMAPFSKTPELFHGGQHNHAGDLWVIFSDETFSSGIPDI